MNEKQWWMKYWDVVIATTAQKARFKKNRLTGAVYVFQSNCKPNGNSWNECGYGWGAWERIN